MTVARNHADATGLSDQRRLFLRLKRSGLLVSALLHQPYILANSGRTEELDDFLKPILEGTAENTPEVKQLLCLETGVQSNGSHAGFICYRCTAGTTQIRMTGQQHLVWGHSELSVGYNFESSHPKLAAWLNGHDHDGELLRISLGPKGQFFASSNRGYRWHGVKDEFQEDVQSMMTGGGG